MLSYITGIMLLLCFTVAAQSQKDIDSLLIKSENLVYFQPAKAAVLNDFIFREAKSVTTRTDALLLQAEAYEMQLKYYDALQKIIQAKDFISGQESDYCTINTYLHLSEIFRKIDLPVQADEALHYAEKLIAEKNNPEFARLHILLLLEQSEKSGIAKAKKLKLLRQCSTVFNTNKEKLHYVLGRRIEYSLGMAYMEEKDFESAKLYFKKLLPGKVLSPIDCYTLFATKQLGEIAFIKGNTDEAANFLRSNIDNKEFTQLAFLRNYELLAKIYAQKKDYLLFARYRELYLLKLNEFTQMEQGTRVLAVSFYESSRQNEITESEAVFNRYFLLIIGLFTVVLSSILVYYIILKKRYKDHSQTLSNKKLLEDTIESMKSQFIEENAVVPFSISEKAEQAILDKLEAFEKTELFTDQELSLKSLAKQLDTNTKYLSEIINSQKNKNFKTYVNELRINYIVQKLRSHPEYRQYKTSHLANEAGFTSRSSFTIVFKTVTGFSPSVFIASLEDKPL